MSRSVKSVPRRNLLCYELVPRRNAQYRPVCGGLCHACSALVPHRVPPELSSIMVSMSQLSTKERAQIIGALVEGNSPRVTSRLTGAVQELNLLLWGMVEVNGIWSYCYAEKMSVPRATQRDRGYGDVWTFTAVCDTKLVPTWLVGERTRGDAEVFLRDPALRMGGRIQLSTDGQPMYMATVGQEVDRTKVQKDYTSDRPRAAILPAGLRRHQARPPQGLPGTRRGSRPATSSGRTSPCGWGYVASRASPSVQQESGETCSRRLIALPLQLRPSAFLAQGPHPRTRRWPPGWPITCGR